MTNYRKQNLGQGEMWFQENLQVGSDAHQESNMKQGL